MLNTPDYLDEEGAVIWRELGPLLLRAGLFTVVDQYALGMFCVAAGRFITATRNVRRTGGPVLEAESGNLYQNPWYHVANKAFHQMRSLFGEFGLTPAERARLEVTAREDEPSLAELLFQMTEVEE
jgi:P27 family predicted phage terminase small subunit